jgi:protein-S-isoprenylcysteine O-methyltransferase Ste14
VKRRDRGGWSEGTKTILVGLALYIVVAVLIWVFPVLRFSSAQPMPAVAAGYLLVVAALVVWFAAARQARAAYGAGFFPTTGLFAWVRHPIVSAFIFVQGPGLILLLWGWPALALPFAAYGLYRASMRRDEEALLRHFGGAYEAYRRTVPALVPRPRRRPKAPPGAGGEPVDKRVAARKAAAARAAARRRGKDRPDDHLRGL